MPVACSSAATARYPPTSKPSDSTSMNHFTKKGTRISYSPRCSSLTQPPGPSPMRMRADGATSCTSRATALIRRASVTTPDPRGWTMVMLGLITTSRAVSATTELMPPIRSTARRTMPSTCSSVRALSRGAGRARARSSEVTRATVWVSAAQTACGMHPAPMAASIDTAAAVHTAGSRLVISSDIDVIGRSLRSGKVRARRADGT